MDKKIKFRAWNKEKLKMVEALWRMKIDIHGNILWTIDHYDGNLRLIDHEETDGNERFVLMQFTGLHDKNGKDVYKSDIVKAYVHNGLYSDEWVGEIVFEKGMFGIRYGDLYKHFYALSEFYTATKTEYISNVGEVVVESKPIFEVIGNIHENPELLESR